MKVLDIGSGVGDVALTLAELVGPTGTVVGVDINPAVLEIAQERVQTAGYTNVVFKLGDVHGLELDSDFDAVVGRLILMHLADPVATLQHLTEHLRPGGLIAFQDYDITRATSYPHLPLFEQAMEWLLQALIRAGRPVQMGLALPGLYVKAGLPIPDMYCAAPVGAKPGWEGADLLANTVRDLMPVIERFGIATAAEVDIETLGARLRQEVAKQLAAVRTPDLIGAWTHKA